MPITITENRGLRQIEALAKKVNAAALLGLCETLAQELVNDLSTVPWGGNIKRGLTYTTQPKRTPTGGWMIGVGSLDILHRQAAPSGTISAFLEWYRGQTQERQKQRAKTASMSKSMKAARIRRGKEIYRRSILKQLEILRARESGSLTAEMRAREDALDVRFLEAERRLKELMTMKDYERFESRFDDLIEEEQRRWEKATGIRTRR